MLRRCSRLQRSQVQTSRPFSVPRVQVIAARAASVAARAAGGADRRLLGLAARLAHGYFFVTVAALALAAALAACLNSRTLVSDVGVDDVGHRAVGAVLGVGADRLLPARRPHVELLADQGREDAGLLVAEPGQRLEPLEQVARHPSPRSRSSRRGRRTGRAPRWRAAAPGRPSTGRSGGSPAAWRTGRRTPRARRRRSRPGASVPNRSRIFHGPRNACSIGYCWSSSIPTSSANGSLLSTSSAASSWAMRICVAMRPSLATGRDPAPDRAAVAQSR